MRDIVLAGVLILALALAFTTHVGLAGRIFLRQKPRWRGPVALFVPPLAFVWALRAGWTRTAGLWLGSILLYAVAAVLAHTVAGGG